MQKQSERKNTLLCDNHLSLEAMAEQYRSEVKRKASQNPPTLRVLDNMTDVLAQKPQVGREQADMPNLENQNTYRGAMNKRNISSLFDE